MSQRDAIAIKLIIRWIPMNIKHINWKINWFDILFRNEFQISKRVQVVT